MFGSKINFTSIIAGSPADNTVIFTLIHVDIGFKTVIGKLLTYSNANISIQFKRCALDFEQMKMLLDIDRRLCFTLKKVKQTPDGNVSIKKGMDTEKKSVLDYL